MRHNASYPKCSRSENASKCKQLENEECSCRECKQRGSIMHLNATNPRMQHKENALKYVQMLNNAQKCMRMRYVINYTTPPMGCPPRHVYPARVRCLSACFTYLLTRSVHRPLSSGSRLLLGPCYLLLGTRVQRELCNLLSYLHIGRTP